jgi:hypothetical protein
MKNELSQAASKRDDIAASNAAVLHEHQLLLTNVESQAQAAQEQVHILKILTDQSNYESNFQNLEIAKMNFVRECFQQ